MGKSTIGCLTIFILGYIIYQDHAFIEKIKEHRFKFLSTFVFAALSGVIYTLSLRGENLNILSWVVDGLFKNIVLISALFTFAIYEFLKSVRIFNFFLGMK